MCVYCLQVRRAVLQQTRYVELFLVVDNERVRSSSFYSNYTEPFSVLTTENPVLLHYRGPGLFCYTIENPVLFKLQRTRFCYTIENPVLLHCRGLGLFWLHFREPCYVTLQRTLFCYTTEDPVMLHYREPCSVTLQRTLFCYTTENPVLLHYR